MTAAITHRRVRVNGIDVHLAEAGDGPPVVLLHGFPELWCSWRHQLPAVARAGYHVIAPDLRGYGLTTAPGAVEDYAMTRMVADVTGLLDLLGEDRAVLVGHDWGANIAWATTQLHPGRVRALVALSVPLMPRPPAPPTRILRQMAGDHFNWALYFQEPGTAEAEMEADVPRTLRLVFSALSGDAPGGLAARLLGRLPAGSSLLDPIPDPGRPPAWLTDGDFGTYVTAFERTGFTGSSEPVPQPRPGLGGPQRAWRHGHRPAHLVPRRRTRHRHPLSRPPPDGTGRQQSSNRHHPRFWSLAAAGAAAGRQ